MPLVVATLQNALQTLFEAPPATEVECAQQWASAIGTYTAPIFPPSTSVAAAQSALAASLVGFGAENAFGAVTDTALAAFAATLGAGMLPTYTAVPPPSPPSLALVTAAPQDTAAAAAQLIATAIDTWMRTGTATLVAPPFTPVVWT